jgi:hypothetical protein
MEEGTTPDRASVALWIRISTGSRAAPGEGAAARYSRSAHSVICRSYMSSTPVADMTRITIPAVTPTAR